MPGVHLVGPNSNSIKNAHSACISHEYGDSAAVVPLNAPFSILFSRFDLFSPLLVNLRPARCDQQILRTSPKNPKERLPPACPAPKKLPRLGSHHGRNVTPSEDPLNERTPAPS